MRANPSKWMFKSVLSQNHAKYIVSMANARIELSNLILLMNKKIVEWNEN